MYSLRLLGYGIKDFDQHYLTKYEVFWRHESISCFILVRHRLCLVTPEITFVGNLQDIDLNLFTFYATRLTATLPKNQWIKLSSWKHISVKFELRYINFHWRKWIWNCRLRNDALLSRHQYFKSNLWMALVEPSEHTWAIVFILTHCPLWVD